MLFRSFCAGLLLVVCIHSVSAQKSGQRCEPLKLQATAVLKLGEQVESPVFPLSQPNPKYPPELKAIGVTGRVGLVFVVGSNGKAEECSITVVEATDSLFISPALLVILDSQFRPAELKGVPVRAVVKQTIVFALAKR